MISIRLRGLQGVIEAIRALPTAVGRETIFEDAVEGFATVLAEKTPPGMNLKLGQSVLTERLLVGYSKGVEEAGDTALDGKPRKGRRRWVSVDELETVLQDSINEYTSGGSVIGYVSGEVDSVLS